MQKLLQRNGERQADAAYGINIFIREMPIMLRDFSFALYADCLAWDK